MSRCPTVLSIPSFLQAIMNLVPFLHHGTIVYMLHHAYILQVSSVGHSIPAPLNTISYLRSSYVDTRFTQNNNLLACPIGTAVS
jgi:hypothetical protein